MTTENEQERRLQIMELFYNYPYEKTDAKVLVSELKKIEALAQQRVGRPTGQSVLFRFFEGGKLTTIDNIEQGLTDSFHPI